MRIVVRGTDKALQLGERMRQLPERMSEAMQPVLLANVRNSIRERAYRTGALMNSAASDAAGGRTRAFTFLEYGKFIEYGTRRMSERKPFRVGRDAALLETRSILKQVIKG